jgi:5-methylcytosine-specific restriction endonuclease McrA
LIAAGNVTEGASFDMDIVTEKKCSRCKKVKPIADFSLNKHFRDGYSYNCKKCCSETSKEYRTKHPEKHRRSGQEWKEKNREKARAINRKWYAGHKEVSVKATLRWVSNNLESTMQKRRVYKSNYKARKRNAEGSITSKEWIELCNKYGNQCLRCGRSDVKLTLDHVIPLSLGGSNSIDNIQPLCMSCNCSKQDRWEDYR